MPRRWKKQKHDEHLVQSKNERILVNSFFKMIYYINKGDEDEEELIEMLNLCPIKMLEQTDKQGNFLIYHACRWVRYEKLALHMWTLYPNAVLYQSKWYHRNLLQIAISHFRHDIINKLMKGAVHLVNEQDGHGSTALFDACQNNQVDLVKLMLSNTKTNVNQQNDRGHTALHVCCQFQNTELYEIFLDHKNIDFSLEDNQGHTTFDSYFTVVSHGNYDFNNPTNQNILAKFAHKFASNMLHANNRRYNMIHAHVCNNWRDFDAFDYLMRQNYASKLINQQDGLGNTPFHYACSKSNGICENHYKRLIKQPGLLLNMRNDKGRTPFHSACHSMNTVIVTDLIDNPCVNIEMIDKQGENALHHIIQRFIKVYEGNTYWKSLCMNTIHILLEKNPFLVCQQNYTNETAIDYACICENIKPGHISTVVWLNRRPRRMTGYRHGQYNKEFWSSLGKVLKDYQMKARFRMYTYFNETITNDIINNNNRDN
jgi:ankyrin repeat protein